MNSVKNSLFLKLEEKRVSVANDFVENEEKVKMQELIKRLKERKRAAEKVMQKEILVQSKI
jgi:predicted transcriptional regulator